MVTFTVAPSSLSVVKIFDVFGDKLERGMMASEVLGVGKFFVGA